MSESSGARTRAMAHRSEEHSLLQRMYAAAAPANANGEASALPLSGMTTFPPPAASGLPEGSPESGLVATTNRLVEEVKCLHEAIGLSRARESSLHERVEKLEALVSSIRADTHELSAQISTRTYPLDCEHEKKEEEEDFEDSRNMRKLRKPLGSKSKTSDQRGGAPNRHNARSVRDGNSSSEDETSEDKGGVNSGYVSALELPRGPRVSGLVELTTRRPEFKPLVSYRTYRLKDRSQLVDDTVTS
jgi:hypothetical protein